MKIFECGNCLNPLFFENVRCEKCGHYCGFSLSELRMVSFVSTDPQLMSDGEMKHYKYCKNQGFGVCNWLISADQGDEFCKACALNRIIPDLSDAENFKKWQKLEVAKHRLVYQLERLKLPLDSKTPNGKNSLCFDFVSRDDDGTIMTGHANGVVTILLSEADSVHREQMRTQMSEPYRALIGHFRHEVGHYFWDLLVLPNKQNLKAIRRLFGDERADYAEALNNYYQEGAPIDWQQQHISEYSTAHPWEDWAETWAHYLHIMDMAETAYFFGMSTKPRLSSGTLRGSVNADPYEISRFETIFKIWMPVSFAINSLNRSMGVPDAYPFVVSPAVVMKMKAIHQLIMGAR